MIVEPKVRGFICTTAHPTGCYENVLKQVNYVKSQPRFARAPKNVLVIGASTGYGLASRIAATVGANAKTICLRAVDAAGFRETERTKTILEKIPRRQPTLLRAAFRLGLITAQKNMAASSRRAL